MIELGNLKRATSLHDLAELLGYEPKSLSYIVYKIPEDKKYITFSISKRSGGLREIKSPAPELKKLQRKLADFLNVCSHQIEVSKKELKPLSHGFKEGLSIVTNARLHKNRRHVFNLDLEGFFQLILEEFVGFLLKIEISIYIQKSLPSLLRLLAMTINCHKEVLVLRLFQT